MLFLFISTVSEKNLADANNTDTQYVTWYNLYEFLIGTIRNVCELISLLFSYWLLVFSVLVI